MCDRGVLGRRCESLDRNQETVLRLKDAAKPAGSRTSIEKPALSLSQWTQLRTGVASTGFTVDAFSGKAVEGQTLSLPTSTQRPPRQEPPAFP